MNNDGLSGFFARIYVWMFVGLILSAVASFVTLNTNLGYIIFSNKMLYYGLIGVQLILLFGVQLLINVFSVRASYFLFFLYAVLSGILLSGIFVMYTTASIMWIFLISAMLFLGLAVVGFTTKKDLSSFGTVMWMGMVGVFISSLINMFLQNSLMDMIISGIAIIVFCGLTVYDNSAYKKIYNESRGKGMGKFVVLGALHMYINFIMIFVNLLNFFGDRN